MTKPDAEGLQGGDSFNVTVKPVEEGEDPNNPDVTPSDPKLGIQLDIDLTMDETGITVKVPTELIEESETGRTGSTNRSRSADSRRTGDYRGG